MSPFWTKKHDFWCPFGIVFSLFFLNDLKSEKVLFFNTFQWFWTIKKDWFSNCFLIDFHIFSKPLPGTVFRESQCRTFESLFFGTIVNFHAFQNITFWTPLSATKAPNCTGESSRTRFFRNPAFHETIVILVSLGPSVCKKDIFSIMIGKFPVFSDFLCALFYMPF